MNHIVDNLNTINSLIANACEEHGREPGSVELIAVSKTKPAGDIELAAATGQLHFGENYLQEAVAKCEQLKALNLTWHFIGAIQSNKTRDIATHFDWVHTVDREKIARRLSDQRPAGCEALNILIQVNVQNESGKAGLALEEVRDLALTIHALPNVVARGLMAIPIPSTDFETQRSVFTRLTTLRDKLQTEIPDFDTLSMGMTDDMDAAIAAGATFVRIGTAIFGARN